MADTPLTPPRSQARNDERSASGIRRSELLASEFVVAGIAVPKGSRTPGRRRDGTLYTRPAARGERDWQELVAYAARANRPAGRTMEPPYAVEMVFYMPRPARPTHPHPSRTDLDKLIRAVLDGLTRGLLIADDRHVVSLVGAKHFAAAPRVEVAAMEVRP